MKIKYIKSGIYMLPDFKLNKKNYKNIGKYGLLKLEFIKKHKVSLYTKLIIKDELNNYLFEINKSCETILKNMLDSIKKNDIKLSESYKENNQIEWVGLMNNYKNSIEEIILREIIYV